MKARQHLGRVERAIAPHHLGELAPRPRRLRRCRRAPRILERDHVGERAQPMRAGKAEPRRARLDITGAAEAERARRRDRRADEVAPRVPVQRQEAQRRTLQMHREPKNRSVGTTRRTLTSARRRPLTAPPPPAAPRVRRPARPAPPRSRLAAPASRPRCAPAARRARPASAPAAAETATTPARRTRRRRAAPRAACTPRRRATAARPTAPTATSESRAPWR